MEQKEETFWQFVSGLAHDIFFTSFFMYTVSFFLESFYKGIVVNYVNLKIVLIICLASGLYSAAFPPQRAQVQSRFGYQIVFWCLSIAGGVIAYQTSPEVWQWRLVFSFSVFLALISIFTILSRVSDEASS